MNNFGEKAKGSVGYPYTANFFEYPLFILGMGKATNFKFGRGIHRVYANISPLKI